MKVSVSSYSFQKMLHSGELNQLSCMTKAKEIGFDAIEYVDLMPHDGSSVIDYAKKLREESEKLSMPITNYTIGADLMNGSNGDFNAEVKKVKECVDIAAILGASGMRHDATYGYSKENRGFKGFNEALPILVKGCREITEYAQTKNIKTMVENHGFFSQDSQRVEMLVNSVAHENFGLLIDMGNFLCADEDPAIAVGRVAPYAFYAHAKDFHVKSPMGPNPGKGFFQSRNGTYLRGAIVGQGDVPVKHCLIALKQAGYTGDIAIEFEGIEENVMALSFGLENLRRYISEVE